MENPIRKIFLEPLGLVWMIITGLASILSYLEYENELSFLENILVSICIVLFSLVIYILKIYLDLSRQIKPTVKVKNVLQGKHFYSKSLLIILEKVDWIEIGQILTLAVSMEDSSIPFALIEVDTYTTKKYPQCKILWTLTDEDLLAYMTDSSRWSSMTAMPRVKYDHIKEVQNA